MIRRLEIPISGPGLHEITRQIAEVVEDSAVSEGLCTVFIQHTSASLSIQENASPEVCRDLENWLVRLAPEDDPLYTHTEEGPDDMPSHIRSALTATSLGIPILDGRLALGIWQGIFVWEHRRARKSRTLVVHVGG